MQKAKLIMFIVLFMLLFGGVIMLMFSCNLSKSTGITIVPGDATSYFIDGENDRLLP